MSKSPLLRSAAAMLAAVTLVATIGSPAHAADPGVIAGTLTENGAPAANISVSAQPTSGCCGASAITDANGQYRIEGLQPGQYRVLFSSFYRPAQWAYGKVNYSQATLIPVTSGAVSTVDDTLLPTGLVQGTFNAPEPGARITFMPQDNQGVYHESSVGGGGTFAARLYPGRYKISFSFFQPYPTGGYIQYAGGTDIQSQATVFDVTANGNITINETMLPVGRMEGRFTDAAGNGIPGVEVSISRPDLGRGPSAGTDANGYFSFPYIRASAEWKVAFNGPQYVFRQFAFGKAREAEADTITITQGQTTVVNDSRLATGTVKVTAKDALSGVTVDKFQVSLDGAGFGWTHAGEATVADVPVGTHPVSVSAHGYEYAENATTVTVTAGGVVEVSIVLRPKTRIEALVVDATTGQPVEGVCLVAARPQRFVLPGELCYEETTSGPSGRVMAEIQEPGWFHVMAFPLGSQGYGAQWVGPNGGTGNQLLGQLVKVDAGAVAKAPTIKLDRAGTITGQVTSPDGTPVPNAVISLGDMSQSGGAQGVYYADEEGRYTIGDLGPYQWPLQFSSYEQLGIQWSGQAANRHLAQRVAVQSGQTTVYDFRFRAPAQVTTNPAVPGDCLIEAFNLISGDTAAFRWLEDCSQPITLPITGPQWVKMRVSYSDNGQWTERFYETRFIR